MLPSQLQTITTRGVVGMILARLDTGPSAWIDQVAMRMQSTQAIETYAWLTNTPALREFIGGRTPKELLENGFQISNKDYETSIKIKSKDMRRDKIGQIEIRANQLADRALDHPGKLLSNLILNGPAQVCYDGQFFFDVDHEEGDSGVQTNIVSYDITTPTAPTVTNMATAIMGAIQAMAGLKDDVGEPMNQSASEFVVMVPINMMAVALEAVTALLGEAGKSATIPALSGYFNIRVVPNARFSWTDRFAVMRVDEAAKPFILQEEDIPDVIALGDGSEYEQLNKEQLYGIDWTGNVGYGYWQYACQVVFT